MQLSTSGNLNKMKKLNWIMPAIMATLFFANFIYMNVINMHVLSLLSFVPFVLCTGIVILESDKKSIL